MGLLEKALTTEREALATLWKSVNEAKERTADDQIARDKLIAERFRVSSGTRQSALAAFEAHKRGESTEQPSPTRSLATLEELIEGAKAAVKADEEHEARILGSLQAKTLEVVNACAERAAQGYAAHAARLAVDHAQIGGAQEFVRGMTGDSRNDLLDRDEWERLNIPSSQQIATLRGRGVEISPQFHTHALAGGDRQICHQAACREVDSLEAELRVVFGGQWPFKRSVGGGYAFTPTLQSAEHAESARTSRRAALEKAAEGMPS